MDVKRNRVRIGVAKLSTSVTAALDERYPPEQIDVVLARAATTASPKTGYLDSPPLSGGSEIDNNVAGTYCTGAFIVGRGTFPSTWELLTAGHCGSVGDLITQTVWPVGRVDANQFRSGYDSMTIPFTDTTITHRVFRDFDSANNEVYDQIGDVQTQDEDWVGEYMCQAGVTSTFVCGTEAIHDETVYYPDQNQTLYHMREASFPSIPGDSGGPVYDPQHNGWAIGITSGVATYSNGTQQEIFQHIYDAANRIGVTVKTS